MTTEPHFQRSTHKRPDRQDDTVTVSSARSAAESNAEKLAHFAACDLELLSLIRHRSPTDPRN